MKNVSFAQGVYFRYVFVIYGITREMLEQPAKYLKIFVGIVTACIYLSANKV